MTVRSASSPFTRREPLVGAFSGAGALLLLFFLMPIAALVRNVTATTVFDALRDPEVAQALTLTLVAATIATGIGTALGIPLAYVLARLSFAGKRFVEAIVDLPIVIPHPVAGIGLLLIFGRQFVGGRLLAPLGLEVVGSAGGVVLAMLFVSAPFLVASARDGFARVDPRLEGVARTLGCTYLGAVWRVTLPLSWRAMLSGAILMWARAISEFGAIVILTYNPKTASVLIYDRFTSFGLGYALPVAVVLVFITLGIFAVLRGLRPAGEAAGWR